MRQFWSAVFLLVAGVVAAVEARKLPLGTPGAPGPGFFPFALAVGLALVSLILVVAALRERAGGAPLLPAGRRPQLVAVMVALFAYAFALEPLGFIVATFLLLIVLFRVVQRHGWLLALGGSAASALVGHLLFKVWLGVRLPPGPWGF